MYVCVCVRTHVCVRMCVCMRVYACVCVPLSRLKSKDNVSAHISDVTTIGGGKGGAMGLQPHLILRILHRNFILYHRNILFFVS